ncbi:MAG: DUF4168 domain-containing protein [Planktothrix sp. GU0601_MAG3]|nr:MAG: DUF4168 domain-containing protein [Planktothrix sp. GU0601_MAG3]
MMDSLRTLQFMPRHPLTRAVLVGLFSWGAVMLGVVPDVSLSKASGFNTVVLAQQSPEFSEAEIRNYARAVLGIEPRRKTAYNEIQAAFGAGKSVPDVVCSETQSINDLDKNVRDIAVNYCTQAKSIIETNELTITRFNEITQRQKADPALQKLIQGELQRLQN